MILFFVFFLFFFFFFKQKTAYEIGVRLVGSEMCIRDRHEMAVIPFDLRLAALSPAEFCKELLSEGLGSRQVMVGENFRFGKGGTGGPADLLSLGEEYGFSVTVLRMIEDGGGVVSSTRIRQYVQEGRVEEVANLLGRPYALEGRVVRGAGRGRDLGIPTANVEVGPEVATPALGAYVTRSSVDGEPVLPSVTSVGTNPTFEEHGHVRVENHILDFSRGVSYTHLTLPTIYSV